MMEIIFKVKNSFSFNRNLPLSNNYYQQVSFNCFFTHSLFIAHTTCIYAQLACPSNHRRHKEQST